MLNMEAIGTKISTLRKNNKLTQNDLSTRLFVTHQAISKWENGKSLPSIEILYEMTKLFHVSIDYLLDDSEIKHNDYESMFQNVKRNIVVGRYVNCENPDQSLSDIFYLLNQRERNLIISLIINQKLNVNVSTIWPYLNDKERKYLLSVILSGKLKYDVRNILHHLSNEEKYVVQFHKGNDITTITSTIMEE